MPVSIASTWQERAASCISRWALTDLQWLPHESVARVAFCQSPFGSVALKVNLEQGIVTNEARMLAYLGPELCPLVYATAEDLDSLLIERLDTVGDLAAIYPNAREEIGAWLPFFRAVEAKTSGEAGFPTLAKFAEVFDRMLARQLRPEIGRIMRDARNRQGILMGAAGENRLLHGDMHHFNILRESSGRWRLIDPHGVIGHPHYELGAFLRNPWGACYTEPGVKERLAERILLLSEKLDLPASRVAEYGSYGAAFSVAWSIEEDGEDFDGMIVMSEAFLELMVSL